MTKKTDWAPGPWDYSAIEARADEVRANARLIAAAPELYEALEICKRDFESPSQDGRLRGSTYELLCAALAKARGKS